MQIPPVSSLFHTVTFCTAPPHHGRHTLVLLPSTLPVIVILRQRCRLTPPSFFSFVSRRCENMCCVPQAPRQKPYPDAVQHVHVPRRPRLPHLLPILPSCEARPPFGSEALWSCSCSCSDDVHVHVRSSCLIVLVVVLVVVLVKMRLRMRTAFPSRVVM